MAGPFVEQVLTFNRIVTHRLGALDDRYLQRTRPLGQDRVLWEIGTEGCAVRSLRARLGLDAGHLSRLLRALEGAGLVVTMPSPADGRIRVAALTRKGLSERAILDRRSNDLAESILAPLSADQQQELVRAMRTITRLLTTATIEIRPADLRSDDAQRCLRAYFAELHRRSDTGFDAGAGISGEPSEVKRMWVAESARGAGIARRLLAELEADAVASGATTARLETNGALKEAIAMYRSAGYVEVPAFNDEPFAHHWFEKQLTAAT